MGQRGLRDRDLETRRRIRHQRLARYLGKGPGGGLDQPDYGAAAPPAVKA